MKNYEIVECLGEGGSGTVYVVIHPNTGKYLAMKEYFAAEDGEREAALLLGLSVQGVPVCRDCFTDDGKYYLVMDYADGVNLRELVEGINNRPGNPVETMVSNRQSADDDISISKWRPGDGGLSSSKRLSYVDGVFNMAETSDKETIIRRVAEIIASLHSLPIPMIHGDIKPENIIVTKDGEVNIIDFGSAFRAGSEPKTVKATPGYAAPECRTGRCTTESDVYAFGKLMLYVLTGRDASYFPEEPDTGLLLRMGVRTHLAKIITKCLKEEPSGRFHSLHEVLERMKKRRPKSVSLSGFITRLGAIFAFPGIWLYGARGYDKAKYLILAGCILLIGEMLLESYGRRLNDGEFTREYGIFLSEAKSQ